ncbi:MAG: hypothetical protein IJD97_06030 [Clostridia bacterium]|nr:hypothetical protein [Clostridia bacterium]
MNFVKRHKIFVLIAVILCVITFLCFGIRFADYLHSEFIDWIHRSLDYERALEGVDDFTCVFYRDGTYRINYHSGRYSFDYYAEDEVITIFPSIKDYTGSSGHINNLYIESEEGYVMLTKGNKATFYLYEDVILPDVLLEDERVSVIKIKSKREVPFRKIFTTVFFEPKGY